MASQDVAIHELKAFLSRYVSRVRAGEAITITSHGKPVARLVGVPRVGASAIDRLVGSGAAQWNGAKPGLQAPVVLGVGGQTLAELVLAGRD